MTDFQQSINIYNAAGFPGDLAFDGPRRAAPYNLVSTPNLNTIGNAFTITNGGNPDTTGGAPLAGTAQVGGTGIFAGILVNSKEYVYSNASGTPLAATNYLPDNVVGDLATMGEYWALINNQPNVGDFVTYNTTTGALSSVPPLTKFVGSSSTTTLTVASISAGQIQVGMLIGTPENPGVTPGTYITALGTGLGGTGTYTISISQTIAGSTAMKVTSLPATVFSGTATSAGTTLTVATVVSGEVYVGMPVVGTGFAAGTIITAFGSGVGGTGTYTINQANTVTPAVSIAASLNVRVPNCVVSRFDTAFPGLAVIKLTN